MQNVEVVNLVQRVKQTNQFIQLHKIIVFVEEALVLEKSLGKIISKKYGSIVEKNFIHISLRKLQMQKYKTYQSYYSVNKVKYPHLVFQDIQLLLNDPIKKKHLLKKFVVQEMLQL